MPGRLGVGSREILITGPHHEIHQRQLQHGHSLILRVVQFIHRPLARCQILQLAQQIALLLAGALAGGEGRNDGPFGFPLALLERGQPSCRFLLKRLALLTQKEGPHVLLSPLLKARGEHLLCLGPFATFACRLCLELDFSNPGPRRPLLLPDR